MDTTAKALAEHWNWAAEKGLMNGSTARAYRAACTQILPALGENWEAIDAGNIDPDEAVRRFKNLRARDFVPASLASYESRFKAALSSFLTYAHDPGTWKPTSQERSPKAKTEKKPNPSAVTPNSEPHIHARAEVAQARSSAMGPQGPILTPHNTGSQSGSSVREDYGDFTFPLRKNFTARVIIPRDITAAEAKRLSAFIALLVDTAESEKKEESS